MDVVRDIVRGFKAEIAGRVLYFATTGAVLVALARLLSPGAYGVLFLAFALLSVAQLFGDLAIPGSAARYVAEYDELDPERVGYIAAFSFLVVLASSTLVALALAAFNREIAAVFAEPALGPLLLVGGAMILSRSLYMYFRKILQGFKLLGPSATAYGVEGVGRLVFVVGFLLLGYGAAGAVGGYALGYVTAVVVGLVAFAVYVYPDVELRLRGDGAVRDRVLGYAVPLLTTRTAKVADNRLDTVIVGFLLAPVAVGFYTLSKQAVHLLQAPASALGFSAGPWFGDQKAAGNVDRVGDIYTSSLVYVFLLYLPVAAGLALLARPALRIVFGPGYLPATDVLRVLSTLAVLQAVEEVSEDALDYLGRARDRSLAKTATAVVSLVAIAAVVPTFGVVGAAVAKVATHAVYVATLLYLMHAEVAFGVRVFGRNAALILAVTGVMSAVVLLAARYISGLVTLSVVVALGAVTWAVLTVSLGLVDARTVASLIE